MLHALKTIQPWFRLVQEGVKLFEVRKDDRPFDIGDDIVLQEWDEQAKTYTGEEWHGKITYIMRDADYCKKGYCILGIKKKEESEPIKSNQ